MIASVLENLGSTEGAPKLLAGTGSDEVHLLVAVTSDRGLCGGFSANIAREVRNRTRALLADGKTVKLLCVGRKGRDALRRDFQSHIVDSFQGIGRAGVTFAEADEVAEKIIAMFEDGEFDVCTVVYNRFVSAITQVVTPQRLIPVEVTASDEDADEAEAPAQEGPAAAYEFEPSEQEILTDLLPGNLKVQVFRALLESSASEHGARMSAMDNATRNAGEMIDGLTLTYNRTRQAKITSELIEIISGAEAL